MKVGKLLSLAKNEEWMKISSWGANYQHSEHLKTKKDSIWNLKSNWKSNELKRKEILASKAAYGKRSSSSLPNRMWRPNLMWWNTSRKWKYSRFIWRVTEWRIKLSNLVSPVIVRPNAHDVFLIYYIMMSDLCVST